MLIQMQLRNAIMHYTIALPAPTKINADVNTWLILILILIIFYYLWKCQSAYVKDKAILKQ